MKVNSNLSSAANQSFLGIRLVWPMEKGHDDPFLFGYLDLEWAER